MWGRSPTCLRRERCSAAAALLSVGIIEYKPGMNQRILPVQRHAVEEHHALGIDVDIHILEVEHLVGGPGFGIELEEVAEAGAAAAQHAQTQSSVNALAHEGSA